MKTNDKKVLTGLCLICSWVNLCAGWSFTENNPAVNVVPHGGTFTYSVTWAGGPYPSGVYVYSLSVPALGVTPSGQRTILYQAYYPNTYTFSYTIAGLQGSDDGYFRLAYGTNGPDSFRSSANIYLHVSPAILRQPLDTVCILGNSTTMGISCGPSTATFQWFDAASNTAVTSATSGSPQFSPTIALTGKRVYCKISNSYGTVSSTNVLLTVIALPTIGTQPADVAAVVGSNATFRVSATGTPPLTYQWYKSGFAMQGANLDYITLSSVTVADAAAYRAVITNPYGLTNSRDAVLNVGTPVSLTSQPSGATICHGQTACFAVSVSGSEPYSFQWTKDSVPLDGATYSTHCVTNASSISAGQYAVIVTNLYGSITSSNAALVVYAPSVQLSIFKEHTNSVLVQANGTPGYSYVLEAMTNLSAPLNWFPVTTNDIGTNGAFSCMFSNTAGHNTVLFRARTED